MRSLVLSVFLYGCETWTLTVELQRKIQVTEMKCYRKILNIRYSDRIRNEEIRQMVERSMGPQQDFLTMVKKRKLRWYSHISRSDGMAKLSYRGQSEESAAEEDRGKDGKTTFENGQN
ncbi:hypothetical protein Pcinc_006261 [Petrolisthes cinctipes]|uniref:Uncharacterized protein n=1 Tax=Petrolisthes cinctipes TaxID=88211 RepID=A0AAE1GBM8_PETCI|nr:hypothetical protein Pcinc_006261 [Petrolisthes cinctipes]